MFGFVLRLRQPVLSHHLNSGEESSRSHWLSFVSHAPFHFPIGFVLLIPVSILAMLDGVEGSLEQMDGAVVGVDHQLPIGPLRIFVSADEEFEGEQTVIRLSFYSDGRRLH